MNDLFKVETVRDPLKKYSKIILCALRVLCGSIVFCIRSEIKSPKSEIGSMHSIPAQVDIANHLRFIVQPLLPAFGHMLFSTDRRRQVEK